MPLLAGKVAEVIAFLFSFLLHAVVLTTLPDPIAGKPGTQEQTQREGGDQGGSKALGKARSARTVLMELSALLIEHRYAEKTKDKIAVAKFQDKILHLAAELGVREQHSEPQKLVLWLRAWFPLLAEGLAMTESGSSTAPETAGKELESLAKYIDDVRTQWRQQEIAKASSSKLPQQSNRSVENPAEPEWLREINRVRAGLHTYAIGSYEASQSRLTVTLLSRRSNYGSGALLTLALFYVLLEEQSETAIAGLRSTNGRPPSQLGLRIYSNHIEPVLILPKSKNIQIPQVLNLYSGEVEPLNGALQSTYDISILPWAYMEFHQRVQPRGSKDLAIFRNGKSNSREAIPTEGIFQSYMGFELKFPSLSDANKKSNFYNPGVSGFQKLELLIPQPVTKKNQQPVKLQATKETPTLEQMKEDMSDSLEQALKEVMGVDEKSLKSEEKSEVLNSLLEMAKDLTATQSSSDLHNKLNHADTDLIEKLKNDPKSLTPEEIEQLKAMIAGFQLLKERKLPNEDTPYFLADPVVRVATPFESANEFTVMDGVRMPFLLKLPPTEQLSLRVAKSKENKKIKRGFDYRILHPLRDIVFLSQSEVDGFQKLEFSDKKTKLTAALVKAEERLLPENSLRGLQEYIATFHKSLGSKETKSGSENLNHARAVGWQKSLLSAWKFRQLELLLSEEVWHTQWQSKEVPTSVSLLTKMTFETLQKVIENPVKYLRNLDGHSQRHNYMLIQSAIGAWAPAINAYLKAEDPSTNKIWSSLLAHWNAKSSDGNSKNYLPDASNVSDLSDLTAPFLPLLSVLLDPKVMEIYLEEMDSIECEQNLFWVDLPKLEMEPIARSEGFRSVREWGEQRGHRCIVNYFETIPGTSNEMRLKEKFIVTQVGTYIVEKLPYTNARLGKRKIKIENSKSDRIPISAQVFWRLILLMPQDQLRHPSVQALLWKRVKPQMYQVLENEILNEANAENFLFLSSLPLWIGSEEVQNASSSLNVAAEWKRQGVGRFVSLDIELISDAIQQMQFAHIPLFGAPLPKGIGELKLKSYRLLLKKNLQRGVVVGAEKVQPESMKDLFEPLESSRAGEVYTGPSYARSTKYFSTPAAILTPSESWQGARNPLNHFKFSEVLRFRVGCDFEFAVKSLIDFEARTYRFGMEKSLISERDCAREKVRPSDSLRREVSTPSQTSIPKTPPGEDDDDLGPRIEE